MDNWAGTLLSERDTITAMAYPSDPSPAATLASATAKSRLWEVRNLAGGKHGRVLVLRGEPSPTERLFSRWRTPSYSDLASTAYLQEAITTFVEEAPGRFAVTALRGAPAEAVITIQTFPASLRELASPAQGATLLLLSNLLTNAICWANWPDEPQKLAIYWAGDPAGAEQHASEPTWLSETDGALEKLLTLEPGWDSYRARRIDRGAAEFARLILRAVAGPQTPAPSVVPTPSGSVQLEWHVGGIDLEIEVDQGGALSVYFEARGETVEWRGRVESDLARLSELISKLPQAA